MASTPMQVVALVELGPAVAAKQSLISLVAERELDRVDALLRTASGEKQSRASLQPAEPVVTERVEADIQRLSADLRSEVRRLLALRRPRPHR